MANFTYNPPTPTYTISVSANPSNGGTVTGGGTYQQGQSCTVSATTNSNYTFTNWTENGSVASTQANYTFTVTGNRTLVANFTAQSQVPQGAINGQFTINANGDKVYFSQGNLQYQASTNTWRFAENQWDYVGTQTPEYGEPGGTVGGSDNSMISQYYNGWIDLFCWGTSGWSGSGATFYHPWDIDHSDASLYGPPGQHDLTGTYAQADWGVYNPISNGGNQANQWRTLAHLEWDFVIRTRNTISGIRFVKAKIMDTSNWTINGVILLPDDWTASTYALNNPNPSGSNSGSYEDNTISLTDWNNVFDVNGAVFLPATGWRHGTSVGAVHTAGEYWSTSGSDSNHAGFVYFGDTDFNSYNYYTSRYEGVSVRLVCPVEN